LSCICASSSNYPYFYLSLHGGKSGTNDIWKYDSNANLVQQQVLNPGGNQISLRSMAFNPAAPTGNLYIANADNHDSRVIEYSACKSDGTRDFIKDFVTSDSSNQILHPYGLAFGYDSNGNELYVSSQDINLVTSYSTNDGSFTGVTYKIAPNDVRGLAFHNSTATLYMADKEMNQMVAFNVIEGVVDPANTLAANDPISMFIDEDSNYGYISSNGDNSVLVYNLNTHKLIQTLTDPNLSHPAGSTVINGTLFVVSQSANGIVSFNLNTWASNGLVISNLQDAPEQIVRTAC